VVHEIVTRPVQARLATSFKRWIAIAGLTAATAMAFGGCAYFRSSVPLDREPPDKWFVSDVPVPDGFLLDKENSRMYDRGRRECRLIYRRDSYIDADRAVTFYKEQFPLRGWKLKFIYGIERTTMIFFKGDEECRVTVDRKWGDAYTWSVIEVEPKDFRTASTETIARKVE
jgi:hypothetical protein